jgi:hypothetical protein
MRPAPEANSPDSEDESPGVPWFRSWRGVYWFIVAAFVVYVVFLAVLPRLFA